MRSVLDWQLHMDTGSSCSVWIGRRSRVLNSFKTKIMRLSKTRASFFIIFLKMFCTLCAQRSRLLIKLAKARAIPIPLGGCGRWSVLGLCFSEGYFPAYLNLLILCLNGEKIPFVSCVFFLSRKCLRLESLSQSTGRISQREDQHLWERLRQIRECHTSNWMDKSSGRILVG